MATAKRTDTRGRILKDGESQRSDGIYRYRYTDAYGKRHDVYSNRLVATDKVPKGSKPDLSLREKEKQINRDLDDGIKAQVENFVTLNELFQLYMSTKTKLKESTRANYIYMYEKYVQDALIFPIDGVMVDADCFFLKVAILPTQANHFANTASRP